MKQSFPKNDSLNKRPFAIKLAYYILYQEIQEHSDRRETKSLKLRKYDRSWIS